MFVLNLNTDNNKVHFYSDVHLGHDKDFIYGPRNVLNVAEHDEVETAKIKALPAGGTLFLLGDTLMGPDGYNRFLAFLKLIPSKELFLMPGNHFSGLKEIKREFGRQFKVGDLDVSIIENYYEARINGQSVVLCHYPIMSWNGAGKGAWMIHGHVHGKIETSLPNNFTGGKILDVGPESVQNPISFAEVEQIMAKKPFKQVDHHRPNTQNAF